MKPMNKKRCRFYALKHYVHGKNGIAEASKNSADTEIKKFS